MSRRILIADDHFAIQRGISALLREEIPNSDVDVAATQPELLAKVAASTWNLVLLDLSMPGRGGLECVREIKDLSPSTAVLIYTMHPEDELGVRALRSGADGYLTKDKPPDEVIRAVKRVLEGKRYISDTMAERMAEYLVRPDGADPHESLSDREYQILALLGRGRSVSEIAEELHLSVKTVSTYRTRVLEKLHLDTTGELIRYAVEHNIR